MLSVSTMRPQVRSKGDSGSMCAAAKDASGTFRTSKASIQELNFSYTIL